MENKQLTTKDFFAKDNVKEKFNEMLGKRAPQFITSVLQIVSSNDLLKNADPVSIFNSAAVAATLDLPLNNSLGFAYIVPYNQKQKDGSYKQVAQFQLGYKGFIQLAQRSGQFKTISATPIYEGQLIESNPLKGYIFDFNKKTGENVIGFAGYFELINGFEKTLYMSVDEMKGHGLRFSKTYKSGLWQTDFIGMGNKTVIKLLLSKFAPLSIEMQKAVITDQAVIKNHETNEVSYVDNSIPEIDKEEERITLMIENCSNSKDLHNLKEQFLVENIVMTADQNELFNNKQNEFNNG